MKINFNPKKVISEFAKYSAASNMVIELGATLIGNILVGVFIGIWLGNVYGNKTVFIITFLFIGLASGFYQVWKISMKELEKIENEKRSKQYTEDSNIGNNSDSDNDDSGNS
jgi:F0F1-type ATP synthase assembly protein I